MKQSKNRLRSERWPLPLNESQFIAYMERLDRYFVEIGVPLVARQLAAIAEACFDLGDNRVAPNTRPPNDGCYSGDDLILRVIAWYDDTYDRALTIRDWLPHALVTLRGELWRMNFPVVYGTAVFFGGDLAAGPAVLQVDGRYRPLPVKAAERSDPKIMSFNVVDFIEDLPGGVRASLHRGDLNGVLYVACRSRVFAHAIVHARHSTFMEDAMADLGSAVDHLLKRPPQPGASKWSSLQATEKALKSILTLRSVPFPIRGRKGHDLEHLAKLVAGSGGPALRPEGLQEIVCNSDVRYDRTLVSTSGAGRAHGTALEIVGVVAMAIRMDAEASQKAASEIAAPST